MNRTVNSPCKARWLIECDFPHYRIGNRKGTVPKGCDCIISGWHFKKGKIVNRGSIDIVPGDNNFIITGNIIEN